MISIRFGRINIFFKFLLKYLYKRLAIDILVHQKFIIYRNRRATLILKLIAMATSLYVE